MTTQSSAHAKCNIVRISVDYSGAQRQQTGRFGKCSSASAVEGFHERYKTPKVAPMGSTLLDCVGDDLERLEIRAGDCEARDRDRVAAKTFQTILAAVVSIEWAGTPGGGY